MKIKIIFALFCAVFPLLFVQGQAQSLQRPVAKLSTHEYALVYLWVPDTSHKGRSHWRWVLHRVPANIPTHGVGPPMHIVVEVKSLDAVPLKEYIRRLPSGSIIGMGWQFNASGLAHQAGLTGLQRLCTSRRIGFNISYFGGP